MKLVRLSYYFRNLVVVESRNDKRPMLSDMKEAGGIEADASLAMLLYRDDYYNQDEEDELGKSIVECNIAKNKDGETGVIEFEYTSVHKGL